MYYYVKSVNNDTPYDLGRYCVLPLLSGSLSQRHGAKLTTLTHKIEIQLHLVAESCTICSSRSRRPDRKFLNTPSYNMLHQAALKEYKYT
jgi:hypothetical protein